jgi:hypothetical protein
MIQSFYRILGIVNFYFEHLLIGLFLLSVIMAKLVSTPFWGL